MSQLESQRVAGRHDEWRP